MILNEKDIIAINQEFHTGKLSNRSSLAFAVQYARRTKNWQKALAYLVRAILIDHVFEDGNKRTTAALILAEAYHQGLTVDKDGLGRLIVHILRKNVTNIREIERLVNGIIE